MFKGMDISRPWPATGMTSEKWLSVLPRTVNMHNLILTQDGIYFKPLLETVVPVGGDYLPHVVIWNKKLYLEDGHHRVMKLALNNIWRVQARVLDLDIIGI